MTCSTWHLAAPAKAEICPSDGTLGWEGFRGWTRKQPQISVGGFTFRDFTCHFQVTTTAIPNGGYVGNLTIVLLVGWDCAWMASLSHSGGSCEETNLPVGNIMVLNSAWPQQHAMQDTGYLIWIDDTCMIFLDPRRLRLTF